MDGGMFTCFTFKYSDVSLLSIILLLLLLLVVLVVLFVYMTENTMSCEHHQVWTRVGNTGEAREIPCLLS